MAALVSFVVPNMDPTLYAGVSTAIQTDPPRGLLFHCATEVEGGMRIDDVWESAEAFETFAQTRLGPQMASTPAGAPEDLTVTPLHAYWTVSA